MSYTYNPIIPVAENLRLLLADQTENGATAARYNGVEGIDVLMAKVVINNAATGGGAIPTDNLTLSGTLTANAGVFSTLESGLVTIVAGTSLADGILTLGFNQIVGSGFGNILTMPDKSGTLATEPRVVSGNTTAILGEEMVVVATATITDPSPVEGKGYKVLVRNGTATVGGTPYAVAGTLLYRVFHSGGWATYRYAPA